MLYLLLALATAIHGIFLLLPVIEYLKEHPIQIGDLTPQITFAIIWLSITLFYFCMSALLFTRNSRRLTIIGSAISCIFLPFGTIAGILVLTRTRRNWPKVA